jgi:methyl-accepting chemotaxis protein
VLRPTIRNKLVGGFGALILLMAVVAAIGCRAVLELRHSALETARVGDRLDSISLEIQVHNLEAQRRIAGYLENFRKLGAEKAREEYLDEAQFEIHEIQSLALKAVKISPNEEKRAKFQLTAQAANGYSDSVDALVQAVEKNSAVDPKILDEYQSTSQHLNEAAEDGEMAGRDASQTSQDRIEQISKTSVPTVIAVSLLGLGLALIMSVILLRAILLPVDHLKDVAENVSMGNLSMNVRRFSNDEIGDLADSFSRMVTAVRFFQSEAEAANQSRAGEAVSR